MIVDLFQKKKNICLGLPFWQSLLLWSGHWYAILTKHSKNGTHIHVYTPNWIGIHEAHLTLQVIRVTNVLQTDGQQTDWQMEKAKPKKVSPSKGKT